MLKDKTVSEYLKKTASGEPVPGGGSIAALSAAAAASLTEMVANLTIGKKGYESVEAEMQEIVVAASKLRDKFIGDIDNDPQAYQEVMAAFKLPKNSAAQKQQRTKAIQNGFKKAALIPMGVAEDGFKIMEFAERVIKKGNKNAVTDGAVAVMAARTAVMAALFNVKINLTAIRDEAFVAELTQKVKTIEHQVEDREKEILSHVNI